QVATLMVLLRPVITMQPQSQTVIFGSDASFSISATGAMPLSYSWRLNGVIITNIILNATSCVFTIHNVQTNNSGAYRVGITNIAGNAVGGLSSTAVLNAFYPVVGYSSALTAENCGPANGAIDPGETVTLELALIN